MPDLFDSCKIAPVTECILSHLMQADQANMASASAVLGLLPTVLSMMGSSTVDIGLLAVRRPGQLSLRTVLSMSEETMYLQGIWALGTVPIHIFGCSVLLGCALCVGACLSILTPAVVRLYIHDFRHLFSPLLRS